MAWCPTGLRPGLGGGTPSPACVWPPPIPHPLPRGPEGPGLGVKGPFPCGQAELGFVLRSVGTWRPGHSGCSCPGGLGPELCPLLSCRGRILSSWPSP